MATPEALSELIANSHKALADTLADAFQNLQIKRTPTVKLTKFCGRPRKSGDPSLEGWLADLDAYSRSLNLTEKEQVEATLDHLGGAAREEVLCCPEGERDTAPKMGALLRSRFGASESLGSLNSAFYARTQLEGETLTEFSRSLMRMYERMEGAADLKERDALRQLRNNALREQFIGGVMEPSTKRELRRLSHDHAGVPFYAFREVVLDFFRDVDLPGSTPQTEDWSKPSVGNIAVVRKRTKSDHELLVGLVESQQQLSAAVGCLVQNQSETNSKLQRLIESVEDLKKEVASNAQKSARPSVQCTFCGRNGHTYDRCFSRKRQEREQAGVPQGRDTQPPRKPLHEGVQSGNATPPS